MLGTPFLPEAEPPDQDPPTMVVPSDPPRDGEENHAAPPPARTRPNILNASPPAPGSLTPSALSLPALPAPPPPAPGSRSRQSSDTAPPSLPSSINSAYRSVEILEPDSLLKQRAAPPPEPPSCPFI